MAHSGSHFVPQLATAAVELHRAADLAALRSEDNPFSPWAALASQLRLVASGLSALVHPPESSPGVLAEGEGDLGGCLSAASAALEEISPADAPEDLAFWVGHIDDLNALIADLGLAGDERGRRS
ncbi:hypothetical protein ACFQU3_19870 [Terrabacter sp. GCM10028922]|uniref:hypothetical protein n=1 Tax=Terrabacter sp. GCM10028922 TaxID=3273428 RepID=UPI00360FFD5B